MFETHKLTEQGEDEICEFKGTLQHAVEKIEKYMPDGFEKSLFKTNFQTALYWGEMAIAGKEGNYSEIVHQNMNGTIIEKPC